MGKSCGECNGVRGNDAFTSTSNTEKSCQNTENSWRTHKNVVKTQKCLVRTHKNVVKTYSCHTPLSAMPVTPQPEERVPAYPCLSVEPFSVERRALAPPNDESKDGARQVEVMVTVEVWIDRLPLPLPNDAGTESFRHVKVEVSIEFLPPSKTPFWLRPELAHVLRSESHRGSCGSDTASLHRLSTNIPISCFGGRRKQTSRSGLPDPR